MRCLNDHTILDLCMYESSLYRQRSINTRIFLADEYDLLLQFVGRFLDIVRKNYKGKK